MKHQKKKEPHIPSELEIIRFEFSDIVTASGTEDKKPQLDNMDSWV